MGNAICMDATNSAIKLQVSKSQCRAFSHAFAKIILNISYSTHVFQALFPNGPGNTYLFISGNRM